MTKTLALNAEDEQLTTELKQLNAEFLDLFILHKGMVENESVILTSLYLEKLGHLQLELLHKRTRVAHLKMKMQMIQAAINRNETPDLAAIEKEISKSLENYYAEIEAQAANLERARKVLDSLLSEEETQKLKEIFRLLCKKLHPDLNPGQSEEEKDLFIEVKAAFDLQKINELQKILLYVEGFGNKKPQAATVGDKKERIERLKKNIALLREKIQQLEENFPFSMKDLIFDERFVAKSRENLQNQIRECENEIKKYQNYISIMINE